MIQSETTPNIFRRAKHHLSQAIFDEQKKAHLKTFGSVRKSAEAITHLIWLRLILVFLKSTVDFGIILG